MSDTSPQLANLSQVITKGIDNRLKEVHTGMPGIIESFDPNNQTASVQPAIRRIFITRESDREILTPADLPLLINVPVYFPRAGGYSMTMPVRVDDECWLSFSERSIDNWYNTGGVSNPSSRRFHSLSDAIAMVGLSSEPNSIQDYDNDNLQIRKDDGNAEITIMSDNTIMLNNSSGANFTIRGDSGSMRMQNNSGYLELRPDGLVEINGIIFDTHRHAQTPDSSGNVQQITEVPQ